jgi:hypothetical protein
MRRVTTRIRSVSERSEQIVKLRTMPIRVHDGDSELHAPAHDGT